MYIVTKTGRLLDIDAARLPLGSVLDPLVAGAQAQASAALVDSIQRIEIRSRVAPPIVIEYPLRPNPAPSSAPSLIGRLVQPEVQIRTALRSQPYVVAPYGSPQGDIFATVAAGTAVVALLAVYGLWRLVRR